MKPCKLAILVIFLIASITIFSLILNIIHTHKERVRLRMIIHHDSKKQHTLRHKVYLSTHFCNITANANITCFFENLYFYSGHFWYLTTLESTDPPFIHIGNNVKWRPNIKRFRDRIAMKDFIEWDWRGRFTRFSAARALVYVEPKSDLLFNVLFPLFSTINELGNEDLLSNITFIIMNDYYLKENDFKALSMHPPVLLRDLTREVGIKMLVFDNVIVKTKIPALSNYKYLLKFRDTVLTNCGISTLEKETKKYTLKNITILYDTNGPKITNAFEVGTVISKKLGLSARIHVIRIGYHSIPELVFRLFHTNILLSDSRFGGLYSLFMKPGGILIPMHEEVQKVTEIISNNINVFPLVPKENIGESTKVNTSKLVSLLEKVIHFSG